MLGLVELLIQMWLARGGGVHSNDDPKPQGFGGTEQDPGLPPDLTLGRLPDRIKVTPVDGSIS